MSAHAACSPSSANMWMACPASVTLTKDVTRPSSKFAKEGTAAHAVAEMTLKGDIFLPDKIAVEGDEFIVSPGMCRALNPYVSHVQSLLGPDVDAWFEQRIHVPFTSGMVWGTLDCGLHVATGDMHIVDLKFGRGVVVDPFGPQLRLYALGLDALIGGIGYRTPVHLTICQPRVEGPAIRSHTTRMEVLYNWQADKLMPALELIEKGDTTENAGPHCRWCVRKTACGAFARKHQTHAAGVFDDADLF